MYCTKADMLARGWEKELIQITDKSNSGVIDDGILDQAIADASAEIDSYLQGHYSLPLTISVPNLTRISCDIARYYLFETRVTEQVQKRYDAVTRYLEQVAKGVIKLGIEVPATSIAINSAEMTSSANLFGRT